MIPSSIRRGVNGCVTYSHANQQGDGVPASSPQPKLPSDPIQCMGFSVSLLQQSQLELASPPGNPGLL